MNPCSSRSVASFTLLAVLTVYSSSSLNVMSCVQNMAVSSFLCPSSCFTRSMSLVLSYVLVAK